MRNWLIIADDLTGAADCAIAFGCKGPKATVGWGSDYPIVSERTQIFSYNADGRELDADEAIILQSNILEKIWSEDAFLFQKIDSTLRGQPAACIAATFAFLKKKTGHAIGILAPAFPATGRITREGKIFVYGVELEQTELWQRDHTYSTSHMKAIIEECAAIKCCVVGLDYIRASMSSLVAHVSKIEENFEGVIIFDAETQEDLERIACIFGDKNPSRFFIGSAGLAHAFATLCPIQDTAQRDIIHRGGGILLVVGSLAYTSRSAAKKLIATRNVVHCLIYPEVLLKNGDELEALIADIGKVLQSGQDILIEIAVGDKINIELGPQLSKTLSEKLKNIGPYLASFAATGGETASAFMNALGVSGITLFDEVEPGVSLGETRGKIKMPIVTKAGAFGNEDSLVNIFDYLTILREKGKL